MGDRPTCSIEHPTIGPCNLPADHRGAHRVTRVVAAKEFHYFGTNEPGHDPVTAAPLADHFGRTGDTDGR